MTKFIYLFPFGIVIEKLKGLPFGSLVYHSWLSPARVMP